jgi:hypothetical protein
MALFCADVAQPGPRHDDLLAALRSGDLAVLHGIGDFSASDLRPDRRAVADALRYLEEMAVVPRVWTNHGSEHDIQNIGGGQPQYQRGDDPGSEVYCLDLLLQHGIRYFWLDHHATNDFVDDRPPLFRERTRAGFDIQCFRRFRGALARAPDAQTLARQLSRDNLDALARTGQVAIIYQHWGVHRDCTGAPLPATPPVFPAASLRALELLADYRDRGVIEVVALPELLAALAV